MIPPIYALILWAVASPLMFVFLGAKRAVMACFVFGWLFLPKASYAIAGMPDITPSLVIAFGVIVGLVVFAPGLIVLYRFHPVDLFAIVLVTAPLFSSLSNDLGAYNGFSGMVSFIMKWGVPYFCGRILIQSVDDAKEMGVMIVIGALAYVPLCLWEIRMSPTLSSIIYGHSPTKMIMARRMGGWRPVGFLSHGIELGMWLALASFLAIAFWQSRVRPTIAKIRTPYAMVAVCVTLVLSRALGGWFMFFGAMLGYAIVRFRPSKTLLMLLVIGPMIYVGLRVSNLWNGEAFVDTIALISPDRASSFQFRLDNDHLLTKHALNRPVFGWSGWGRHRVKGGFGEDASVTDSMWAIYFSMHGFYGLIGWLGMLLLPSFVVARRARIRVLTSRPMLPVLALMFVLPVVVIDLLFNAFVGPGLIVISGALVSLAPVLAIVTKRLPAAEPVRRAG